MLKIGVLGAGHLGKIHIKLLQQIKDFELIGFYDPDDMIAKSVSKEFNVPSFTLIEQLMSNVDVVDIVTPTLSHFECAEKAVNMGKHVFIEKPMTHSLAEAKKLVELVKKSGVKAQVGHVERFNPAYLSLKEYDLTPMFIEAHRLSQFNPRGTDVSVILDLMIHDIDIILSLVNSDVRKINANGVAVISNSPDIANARIEFENGCVANLTASRISLKNMRKIRLFQKDAYISMDFLDKKSQIVTLSESEQENDPLNIKLETEKGTIYKKINFKEPAIEAINSIKMELELMADCIIRDQETTVTVLDGYKAIDVANRIYEKVMENNFRH